MSFEMWRRAVVSTAAGALLLVACSSGGSSSEESVPVSTVGDDSTTTTSEETTTTSTTTTSTTVVETTTTEVLPTIEVEPNEQDSVADTVGVPDDPEVPVDTMFDPSTTEGEVEQAVLADNEAYKTCLRQLPNCDVAAAVRFGAFEYAEGTAEFLGRYNSEGRVAEGTDSIRVTVEEVRLGESGVEAEVDLCYEDGSSQFIPSEGGTGDRVVAEGFLSVRQEFLLVKLDGEWRVVGSASIESAEGEASNLCRP